MEVERSGQHDPPRQRFLLARLHLHLPPPSAQVHPPLALLHLRRALPECHGLHWNGHHVRHRMRAHFT